MALSLASLAQIPRSFATCSIGCKDEHTLPARIEAIARAGFQGIELSMPDLISFASIHLNQEVAPGDFDNLCVAVKVVKAMCDAKDLKIMILQPFSNFEGWPKGSEGRKDAFDRARGWIRIMQAAGTNMLQVGSSDTPAQKLNTNREYIVADLQALADMLAERGFRLAYENWCWSTHAPDWKDACGIVKSVDRPNVGLCLDTFQTAGGEWGDPTTTSGLVEDISKDELEGRFHKSLEDLSRTVPRDKIYLLQISDAYRMKEPPPKESDASGLRPRAVWSRDFRPLPFEGGYLPVVDVAKAVLRTGFRDWFSYEVFDSGPDGTGREYDLDDFAQAAVKCHRTLLEECVEC